MLGSIAKLIFHLAAIQKVFAVRNAQICFSVDLYADRFVIGNDLNVFDVTEGSLGQNDVAENSVVTEGVLILQIRTAAPLIYNHANGVFALLHVSGYVKFSTKTASLSEADVSSVDIQHGTR